MKLVDVENNDLENNLVNQSQGSSWLYKSDKPIKKKKYYFEVKVTDRPNYGSGEMGYFSPTKQIEYVYYPSIGVAFDTYNGNTVLLSYTSAGVIKNDTISGCYINQILGLGIIINKNTTTLDFYVDGELIKSTSIDEALDPATLYAGTFNVWSHNAQTAQYYFDNDVTYKSVAAKYKNASCLYKYPSGGYTA